MHTFDCDYTGGCLPEILQEMAATNGLELAGYCEDPLCAEAEELIRRECRCPDARVYWIASGTLANIVVLSQLLGAADGVVSPDCGHIHTAETGAIEATGHKVIAVPAPEGRLTPAALSAPCTAYRLDTPLGRTHKTRPAAAYAAFPAENGTVYSLAELEAVSRACDENGLALYIDGARLAYGLAASDVALPDLARLADVFTIGGTKCGALIGDAIVFTGRNGRKLDEGFLSVVRMRGGLIAKGRTVGAAFAAFFRDGLYGRVGERANRMAKDLENAFAAAGCPLAAVSPTNQIFPVVKEEQFQYLAARFAFRTVRHNADGTRVLRLCTSWSTPDEAAVDLKAALAAMPR